MADVTVAEEEYLQTLFWLHEAGLPMTGANVARAMQLSPPTVHEMVGRLERDGYITARATTRRSRSPTAAASTPRAIVRRHRLIERFLTDVLGIPWDEVHEEAERLEHAMSPVLEERMLAAIGDAKTCPHGHPIDAGHADRGRPARRRRGRRRASTVLRFENEAEDLLHELKATGIEPGMEGTLAERRRRRRRRRAPAAARSRSTARVAETVSVIADPSPPPRVALPEQLVIARTATALATERSASSVGQRRSGAERLRRRRRPLERVVAPRRGARRPRRSASASRPSRRGAACSAALEQEVGALDELHAALGRGGEERVDVDALGQLDPHEVAALGRDEVRLGEVALERRGQRGARARAARS